MPEFSLPYNHDIDLLDTVFAEFPETSRFCRELYFPAPLSVMSSGRALYEGDRYEDDIRLLIGITRRWGIESNLLLNPACAGTRIADPAYAPQVLDYLRSLRDLGLTAVTASDFMLAREIKRQVPELKLECSCLALVDTIKRAWYWREIGADMLVIPPEQNKDMRFIEKLRDLYPEMQLKLIANQHCLPACPMKRAHSNAEAHGIDSRAFGQACSSVQAQHPWLYYSTPFIPPSCLGYYQDTIDLFKLVDRRYSTDRLLDRFGSYVGDARYAERTAEYNRRIPAEVFEQVLRCSKTCPECGYCEAAYRRLNSRHLVGQAQRLT